MHEIISAIIITYYLNFNDLFSSFDSSDYHLFVGLVVKASVWKAEDPGFDSCLRRWDFSGSSHTSDFKIGTPVATLPGVNAGTGWPGVSIL